MSRRRSCCCCCGCAGRVEAWAYAAGPIPNPPWTPLFGGSLVATGVGSAVNPAGGTFSATPMNDPDRTIHSISAVLTTDGVAWAAVMLLNFPAGLIVTGGFGVSPGEWGVGIDGIVTGLPGVVGNSQLVVVQWNDAGDAAVTVGGQTVTGSFDPTDLDDTASTYVALQMTGANEGDSIVDPITLDCEPLP